MKSFKQLINEAKMYAIDASGKRKISEVDSINFHHSSLQKSLGYDNLVKVSVTFHNAYKKSGNYISATGKKDQFSNANVRNLVSNGMSVEYPVVEICKEGKIKFINGQHRYSVGERLKMERCVVMSSESCANAKKHEYTM